MLLLIGLNHLVPLVERFYPCKATTGGNIEIVFLLAGNRAAAGQVKQVSGWWIVREKFEKRGIFNC